MKFLWIILVSVSISIFNSPDALESIKQQLISKDSVFDGRWPEYTVNGEWKFREKVNWFSGFISGELFIMYKLTNDEECKRRALIHADSLLKYSSIDYTHDMGFIFLPSGVKAYHETGELKYKEAAIQAAEMLYKRFNTKGNFIRAWGKLGTEKRAGWIIIDTMMNLELLFWAAQETGNQKYYQAAVAHAKTTYREIVRPDYSSFHVVELDPENGDVIRKRTHQGHSDTSTWARGQAWGVYGFCNVYKRTGDEVFLNVARQMANYYLKRLPADYIPYWDLDLSGDDILRDASAGAILASGLYDLAEISAAELHNTYKRTADHITQSLLENYLYSNSQRREEQGLLIHTIYNYHKDWGVDESFPAGDYYFMEALYKYYQNNREK